MMKEELKVGDAVVVGQYASTALGNPTIRWTEVIIIGLPLRDFYPGFITCKKRILP